MREIKFRLSLPETKEICTYQGERFILDLRNKGTISMLNDALNGCLTIKYHYEQYTGFVDSNGIEIYEGDIILRGIGVWHHE